MRRIIVFASFAIIAAAILNVVLHTGFPLRTPPSIVVSTVAMLCGDASYCPSSITFDDHDGNIYAAEPESERIIRIAPSGKVQSIAGLQYGDTSEPYLNCQNHDGVGASARFCKPAGIAYDALDHSVLIADTDNNAVRKLTEVGRVSTIDSSGASARCWDFAVTLSHVCRPRAVAIDPYHGTIWVAQGNAVMRITSDRRIALLAGSDPLGMDGAGCIGRGGKSQEAIYCGASGIAADKTGAVHVAELYDDVVDVVGSNGDSKIEAGERESQLENGFIRNIGIETYISHLISTATEPLIHLNTRVDWGTGAPCLPPRDGAANFARFCQPQRIAEDQISRILYVAESDAIRQIDVVSGRVSTVANIAGSRDNCVPFDGAGTAATICSVDALAVDSRNHLLYFIDGSRLRKITLP